MSNSKPKYNAKLLAFGMAFIALGVLVAALKLFPSVHERISMTWWVPVHATLVEADLKYYSENRGVMRVNIQASYTYSYNNAQYSNSRVTNRFHPQQLGHSLLQAFHNKTLVTIWLDPNNPQDSVVDKSAAEAITLYLGVSVLLFTVGIIFIVFAKDEEPIALNSATTTISWPENSPWSSNRIKSRQINILYISILSAVIYNAIFLHLSASIFYELADSNFIFIFGLIFPAGGLALIAWAARFTRDYFKFGNCQLEMEPFPGQIGGYFGARVSMSLRNSQETTLVIRLRAPPKIIVFLRHPMSNFFLC